MSKLLREHKNLQEKVHESKCTHESGRVVVPHSLGVTVGLEYRVSLHDSVLEGASLQTQAHVSRHKFIHTPLCQQRTVCGARHLLHLVDCEGLSIS